MASRYQDGKGRWLRVPKGIIFSVSPLCRLVLTYSQIQPKSIHALFDRSVPLKLVECITDLLKYDPDTRLTARQCLDHPYLAETMLKNNPPIPISSPPPLQSRPFPRASQQQPASLTPNPPEPYPLPTPNPLPFRNHRPISTPPPLTALPSTHHQIITGKIQMLLSSMPTFLRIRLRVTR
jgi:serine/threonine protein kinase